MTKLCIFNRVKACSSCGDCDVCDLNPNKKCNNCGKCLELEGYDIRAIQIDDIFEDREDFNDYEEKGELQDDSEQTFIEEETWDYIDDIKELKDLLEDDKNLENIEEFPGLINFINHKNE